MTKNVTYYLSLTILLFVLAVSGSNAQNTKNNEKVEWHSYAQLRLTTDFQDYYNFSVPRLKFWIKSGPDFSKHWAFKVQAIFSSFTKEKFFLQDVYGQYNFGKSSIRFGQFIPRYSLQRFQPDYQIPALERARAVNLLIPNGTMGVRDIGIQYNLKTVNDNLQFNIGLFNGYGINKYRYNNSGILAIQNLSYRITFKKSSLQVGYSVMFRKGDNLFLPGIVPDTALYSGKEFGFNVNAIFKSKIVDFQAEYLQSNLDTTSAHGYYGLVKVKFNEKNHAYFLYDNYTYGYDTPLNSPWYIGGFNYLFKSYKIMLTLETGFRKIDKNWINRTELQFQMFFH